MSARPKQIKCAWCGRIFPLTHKGRPKQHLESTRTCIGSGQMWETHTMLNNANARKETPK